MSDSKADVGIWVFIILVFTVVSGVMSHNVTKFAWKEDATNRGFGEYYIDKHHNAEWRWMEIGHTNTLSQ